MCTITVEVDDTTAEALSKVGPTPEEALRHIVASWGKGYAEWEVLQSALREQRARTGVPEEPDGCEGAAGSGDPRAPGVVGLLMAGPRRHRLGESEDAVDALRRAVELSPENPGTHLTLGTVLRAQGDLPGAAECFRQAVALEPDDPWTWALLGDALKKMGSMDDAIAALRRAVELDPTRGEAAVSLAEILAGQGDVDGAVAELRSFIDLAEPRRDEMDRWIGIAQERLQGLGSEANGI